MMIQPDASPSMAGIITAALQAVQAILIAMIGAFGAYFLAKLGKSQDELNKQSKEIHVAVNSKTDAYIREISALRERIDGMVNMPGLFEEMRAVNAKLDAQKGSLSGEKQDALDERLADLKSLRPELPPVPKSSEELSAAATPEPTAPPTKKAP